MLLAFAFVLCAGGALAYTGVLALEAADTNPNGSLFCGVPGGDNSDFAPSHWSWVPPGEVCDYSPPLDDVGATYWRIPTLLAIVAAPFTAALIWRRPTVHTEQR